MMTLTALEDALAADHHGLQRRAWLTRLSEAANALGRQARAPLPAGEHAAVMRRRAAFLAAMAVIDIIWLRQRQLRS